MRNEHDTFSHSTDATNNGHFSFLFPLGAHASILYVCDLIACLLKRFSYVCVCLLVGGDNANSLSNVPSKSNREEKQDQPAATTAVGTPTTAIAVTDNSLITSSSSSGPESDLHVEETSTTTEISFWTDSGHQDGLHEHELNQANIRNASDARGIFSNIVKTLNRGKNKFHFSFSLFF